MTDRSGLLRHARILSETVDRLAARLADVERRAAALIEAAAADAQRRAALAGIPNARLRTDGVVLEGLPSLRLGIDRVEVSGAVAKPFPPAVGITRYVTDDAEVRGLWERLLARETAPDAVLQGHPVTVLNIPSAEVRIHERARLAIGVRLQRPRGASARGDSVVAVPKFTYTLPQRKVSNFGHWLLDCVPQVLALLDICRDAKVLLPHPVRAFHRSTLELVGMKDEQAVAWTGTPLECERLLVLESDGRAGGGRPLSSLLRLRSLLAKSDHGEPWRRLYVSRRDAQDKRQWVTNESDVEDLFRSRGFEIVVMSETSLQEQRRMFREARIIAGVSGAGLADIVFAPPGAHVIVLHSESHVRWKADKRGSRSTWSDERGAHKPLAAFGDSPRFYAHVAAAFEQVCHAFLGEDQLPLAPLSEFLDDVLVAVEAS